MSIKKIKMFVAFCILLICLTAIFILALKWSKSRKIEAVTISGNQMVGKTDLMTYINHLISSNDNPKIDANDLCRLLEKNPYIRKAYITHKNLNTLQVNIKENLPTAAVVLENGQIQYIDSSLKLLPFNADNFIPDVPVIRGVFVDGCLDTVGIVGSLLILSGLKEDGRNYMNAMVSEICYDNLSKCFSLNLASNGALVKLGNITRLEYKIDKLDAYFKSNPYSLAFPPESIDLRWSNHIVTSSTPLKTAQ